MGQSVPGFWLVSSFSESRKNINATSNFHNMILLFKVKEGREGNTPK